MRDDRLQGFKYSDLTWKILVFLKTGCWGEVVATGGLTVFSSNWATRQIIMYNTTPEAWAKVYKLVTLFLHVYQDFAHSAFYIYVVKVIPGCPPLQEIRFKTNLLGWIKSYLMRQSSWTMGGHKTSVAKTFSCGRIYMMPHANSQGRNGWIKQQTGL